MLRDINTIKNIVRDFFREKDAEIECGFNDDKLTLMVEIYKESEVMGRLKIRNKFFKPDGPWDELLKKLEEYYNNKFPNKDLAEIIPWTG